MGSSRRRLFRQLALSRQRAWWYIATNETEECGTIGSDTGDDSTCQEIPSWRKLVEDLERGLAETRKR